jgi:hypothetical protein
VRFEDCEDVGVDFPPLLLPTARSLEEARGLNFSRLSQYTDNVSKAQSRDRPLDDHTENRIFEQCRTFEGVLSSSAIGNYSRSTGGKFGRECRPLARRFRHTPPHSIQQHVTGIEAPLSFLRVAD